MTLHGSNDLADWLVSYAPYISSITGAALCIVIGIVVKNQSLTPKFHIIYYLLIGLYFVIAISMAANTIYWPSLILIAGALLGLKLVWSPGVQSDDLGTSRRNDNP